jgi:hypothetical protein
MNAGTSINTKNAGATTVTGNRDVIMNAGTTIDVDNVTATTGSITLDAQAGALDANGNIGAAQNVTLTGTSVDTAGTVNATAGVATVTAKTTTVTMTGAVTADEIKIVAQTDAAVAALTADVYGVSVEGKTGSVTLNGPVNATTNVAVTAGTSVAQNGNITTTGAGTGDVTVTAKGGNITMAAGTVTDANATTGTIALSATGNVALASLTTDNATEQAVSVIAGGAITDNNAGATNITADAAGAVTKLRAATGIGSGNALETTINTLDALNTGANNIEILEANALNVRQAVTQGAGNVDVRTIAGNLTVMGDQPSVGSTTGTIFVHAGAGDLAVNSGVQSTTGSITLEADRNVSFSTTGSVQSTSGNVTVSADVAAGTNGYTLTMADQSFINAGSGTIAVAADGNVTLGQLTTTNATGAAVTVTATNGAVLDANGAGLNIEADSVGAVTTITAANGVSVDTTVASINVANTTAGAVSIRESGALIIEGINQDGSTISVTAGGNTTVTGPVTTSQAGGTISLDIWGGSLTNNVGGIINTAAANAGIAISAVNGVTVNDVISTAGATSPISIYSEAGNVTVNTAPASATVIATAGANSPINITAGSNDNAPATVTNINILGGYAGAGATVATAAAGSNITMMSHDDINIGTGGVNSYVHATASAISLSSLGNTNLGGVNAGDVYAQGGNVTISVGDASRVSNLTVIGNSWVEASGSITVDASGNVAVGNATTAGNIEAYGGNVDIEADGNVTAAGGTSLGPQDTYIAASNSVSIMSEHGSITLGDDVSNTYGDVYANNGNVTLTALNGNVSLNGNTYVEALTGNVTVNTTNITFSDNDANHIYADSNVTLLATQDITMNRNNYVQSDWNNDGVGNVVMVADYDSTRTAGGGALLMGDGSTVHSNLGTVYMRAAGNIVLGHVDSNNATANAIAMESTHGGILDGGDTADPNIQADAVGAAGVTLKAATGIGNVIPAGSPAANAAIEMMAYNVTGNTTVGDVDINNNMGTAVSQWVYVRELTTGLGDITFDQTGGSDVQFINVATQTGNVTLTNVDPAVTSGIDIKRIMVGDIYATETITITADGSIINDNNFNSQVETPRNAYFSSTYGTIGKWAMPVDTSITGNLFVYAGGMVNTTGGKDNAFLSANIQGRDVTILHTNVLTPGLVLYNNIEHGIPSPFANGTGYYFTNEITPRYFKAISQNNEKQGTDLSLYQYWLDVYGDTIFAPYADLISLVEPGVRAENDEKKNVQQEAKK